MIVSEFHQILIIHIFYEIFDVTKQAKNKNWIFLPYLYLKYLLGFGISVQSPHIYGVYIRHIHISIYIYKYLYK